jgi:3',5'-nucleoside bisphosphate phosphatase
MPSADQPLRASNASPSRAPSSPAELPGEDASSGRASSEEAFDLHTHSVFSDGHHTPEHVVAAAAAAGLTGVALTDHDTGDGLARAIEAGVEHGIEVIPGTEFSAEHDGRSVHVLAYWHDHTEPVLAAELARLRDERTDRARRIVERFHDLGITISFERVVELAAGAPIGRPHIAQAVVESGACSDEREVFDRYLADGGPASVAKHAVDPVRAVELLRAAGGVVVLAHPALFGARDGAEELPIDVLEAMVEAGLAGVEADHPAHPRPAVDHWRALAARYGLLVTAGSDHHGGERLVPVGAAVTGRATLEHLRSLRP